MASSLNSPNTSRIGLPPVISPTAVGVSSESDISSDPGGDTLSIGSSLGTSLVSEVDSADLMSSGSERAPECSEHEREILNLRLEIEEAKYVCPHIVLSPRAHVDRAPQIIRELSLIIRNAVDTTQRVANNVCALVRLLVSYFGIKFSLELMIPQEDIKPWMVRSSDTHR